MYGATVVEVRRQSIRRPARCQSPPVQAQRNVRRPRPRWTTHPAATASQAPEVALSASAECRTEALSAAFFGHEFNAVRQKIDSETTAPRVTPERGSCT